MNRARVEWTARCVSIWIGDITDDDTIEDYLRNDGPFEHDFGFRFADGDMPEVSLNPEPRSIAYLAVRFSFAEYYSDQVIAAAQRQGVVSANAMVVFFNLRYFPDPAYTTQDKPLRFLCTVDYSPPSGRGHAI